MTASLPVLTVSFIAHTTIDNLQTHLRYQNRGDLAAHTMETLEVRKKTWQLNDTAILNVMMGSNFTNECLQPGRPRTCVVL